VGLASLAEKLVPWARSSLMASQEEHRTDGFVEGRQTVADRGDSS
jgi:hypothetical protein